MNIVLPKDLFLHKLVQNFFLWLIISSLSIILITIVVVTRGSSPDLVIIGICFLLFLLIALLTPATIAYFRRSMFRVLIGEDSIVATASLFPYRERTILYSNIKGVKKFPPQKMFKSKIYFVGVSHKFFNLFTDNKRIYEDNLFDYDIGHTFIPTLTDKDAESLVQLLTKKMHVEQ